MKLTNIQLKQIIREELGAVLETQKTVGLDQTFSDEKLKIHIMNFISENPEIQYDHPKREEAEMLLSIISNRVRDAVKHDHGTEMFVYDDTGTYVQNPDYRPETTPEQTAQMRDAQADLKLVKRALMSAMGERSGNSAHFGDMLRAADPTGEKQRSGLRPDQISPEYDRATGRRWDD